jgi:saccharopine dehydrogenase-like NADP-dependent oxidoreductase
MKVTVLGGCADMAVPLNRWLKEDREVEAVVLADINDAKASRLASELGSKFRALKVDANDPGQVMSAVSGSDVALSFVGPFYHFEKDMAGYAIRAKVNYISIADDYDAYLGVKELDAEAKAAGIKILTGFGNSPGLTQILARRAYQQLGGAKKINVAWCAGSDEAAGPSNLAHLLYIFTGTTLQTFDGSEIKVKTGKGKKIVEFPEPIGENPVYYTGHAESVSLPRSLPGLEEATLHGGVKPNIDIILVKMMSALGLLGTHERRMKLARSFHKIEGFFAAKGIDKSVGRIDVYSADGKYKYYTFVGHIAELTCAPMYLAAKWLVAGRFDGKPSGVYSADSLFDDPAEFIGDLEKMGIAIGEDSMAKELRPVGIEP